jgi:hypothetical protein
MPASLRGSRFTTPCAPTKPCQSHADGGVARRHDHRSGCRIVRSAAPIPHRGERRPHAWWRASPFFAATSLSMVLSSIAPPATSSASRSRPPAPSVAWQWTRLFARPRAPKTVMFRLYSSFLVTETIPHLLKLALKLSRGFAGARKIAHKFKDYWPFNTPAASSNGAASSRSSPSSFAFAAGLESRSVE